MDPEKQRIFTSMAFPTREFEALHSPASSLSSTLSSPRSSLGTWSPASPAFSHKFRNRVPTQMRRSIILYITCVVGILLILNADLFTVAVPNGSGASPVFRRGGGSSGSQDNSLYPGVTFSQGGFPKKIWQTWKIDPLQFEDRDLTTARTWLVKNPDFRYEVLTDTNDMGYVEQHFGPGGLNRPDIVDMYRSINATIIKADLLRYMVMYAEGGVYADIDVEALKPISRFIPDHRYNEADIDMVIGVEIDQPAFKDHPILGPKSQSFCQWTFMARPRLPVMLRLIENIMSWLDGLAREQNVPVSEVVLDFDQVISGTGPSAFTIALLEQMNRDRRSTDPGAPEITWEAYFHELDESKVVSRVLVLDVEAFAAGQGHSDSGNHDARGALVKHHYHASNWPSRHPRFSHPAYGPVEQCNWDPACVARWDEDTAAFALLDEEAQKRKIEEIQAEQARLREQQEAFLKALALQEAQQQQPILGGPPAAPAAVEPEVPQQQQQQQPQQPQQQEQKPQEPPLVPPPVIPDAPVLQGEGVAPVAPQVEAPIEAAPLVAPPAPQQQDQGELR